MKFVDALQNTGEPWGRELLAHNLNTVFHNRTAKSQYLFRSLGTQVRGFLSDRYRRLDSRPIVEAFAAAVQQKGALPYDGYVTDTKISIQAIMPEVYEPIPGGEPAESQGNVPSAASERRIGSRAAGF